MKVNVDRRRIPWLLIGTVVYITAVFVVDFVSPPPVDIWVLYLPLILLLTRLNAPQLIVCTAIVCSVLMSIDIGLTQQDLGWVFILVILGIRLVALWLVAVSGIIIIRGVARRKELEREVLDATSHEQQRIGQELHDNVGQELTALGLMANALAERIEHGSDGSKIISRLCDGLVGVQQHIRTLSHGLVPVPVEAKGLKAALEDLANDTTERTGITVVFSPCEPLEIPDHAVATHLYRIAQEAVANALRHAVPQAIRVSLSHDRENLILTVEDDGTGIQFPLSNQCGVGLRIMQYRAEQIGGMLSLRRRETGGTLVICSLALNSAKDLSDEPSIIPAVQGEDTDR
jgi:signal transduction histidine kinase